MANYAFLANQTVSGGWDRFSIKRNATAITGGTSITLNTGDALKKNSIHEAAPVALRAFMNAVADGTVTSNNVAALFVDDGTNKYTVTVKYGATSIDGTALTLPSDTPRTTGLTLPESWARAIRAAKNDKSDNG